MARIAEYAAININTTARTRVLGEPLIVKLLTAQSDLLTKYNYSKPGLISSPNLELISSD